MTTSAAAPVPGDDHKTRIQNLKSAAVPAASASPSSPAAATKPPDPKLMLEKTIDLATEVHAALEENRRLLVETRTELVALKAGLPVVVAETARQTLQPVISHYVGQRQDTEVLKQQTQQGLALHAETHGTLKAFFWIGLTIGLGVLAIIGRSVWPAG